MCARKRIGAGLQQPQQRHNVVVVLYALSSSSPSPSRFLPHTTLLLIHLENFLACLRAAHKSFGTTREKTNQV